MSKDKVPSSLTRYWIIVKNGMFLYGLRNRLALIGLDINLYYWAQEEFKRCDVPIVKDDVSKYTLKHLSIDEVKSIINHHGIFNEEIIRGLENGQFCVGLENNGEIACYTFVELNDYNFNGRSFKLKPNEAYLLNMWTFHNYRGKNLAPYLRYKVYRLLEERGIDKKYSISQYFNKSSIKFKKKLNTKNLYLFLNVTLFWKIKLNFTLKRYKV
ncbi:MAG: GNAT family N-acetyltransferase [Algibacter sp.]|uniref:GNAT family N-acetyltransferase n=1 Tax=Algibacter sp. TaxID=1872428 RepID=UPI0032982A40